MTFELVFQCFKTESADIFTRMTDFIHGHVHALPVVVSDVIKEASRLVLMTHVEAQVARFDCCAQRDVHRAKVNVNVKDDGGGTCQALLIVVKGDVCKQSLRDVDLFASNT